MSDHNKRGRKVGSKNRKTIEKERRSQLLDVLRSIIASTDASADARLDAAEMLIKLEAIK